MIEHEKIITQSIKDDAITNTKIAPNSIEITHLKNSTITSIYESIPNDSIFNLKLKNSCETITNWNTTITNGWYQATQALNSPEIINTEETTYPFNESNQYIGPFVATVIKHSDGYVIQTLYPILLENFNEYYTRIYKDSTWSEYVQGGGGTGGNSGIGFLEIKDHTFTTTAELSYTLPFTVSTQANILIFADALPIYPQDFTIVDTLLTFDADVIVSGQEIYIKYISPIPDNVVITPAIFTFTTTTDFTYTLDFVPINKDSLLITNNGIVIHPDNYDLSVDEITFGSEVISEGQTIVVYNLTTTFEINGLNGNIHDLTFTATTDLTYDLGITPLFKKSLTIIVNSAVVHPDDYSLSGSSLTFGTDTITEGDEIFVKVIEPVIIGGYDFTDAPDDGNAYLRKHGEWDQFIDAPNDDNLYVRKNNEWVLDNSVKSNFIMNGNMLIAQRGTSFAAIARGTYNLDRWIYWKGVAGTMVQELWNAVQ